MGWRGVNRRMPHRGVNRLMPHPVLKNCVRLKFSVRAFPHVSSKNTFQGAPQSTCMFVESFSWLCGIYLIHILNISSFPHFLFTPQQAAACLHWAIYINLWKVACKVLVLGCNIFIALLVRETRPLQLLVVVMMMKMNTLVRPRLYFGLWKTNRPASCQNLKLLMR